MIDQIQDWLKNTIPGIVLLGALGSLLAILLGRAFSTTLHRVLPAPVRFLQQKRTKQAYFLGFMHAFIDNDKTARNLIAFLFFHLSLFITALILSLASVISFSAIIALQSQVALTLSSLVTVIVGFVALYWAYFEFEYIYRTYLFLCGASLESAEQGFSKNYLNKEKSPK